MSLEAALLELISDAKTHPRANYVIWASVGANDYLVGETTLGPTVDAPAMAAALMRQIETRLVQVPLTRLEIAGAEPVLVQKFDAVAAVEAKLKEDNIEAGATCLVDEAVWLMLTAQGHFPQPLNDSDAEIPFKGRSLRRSIAS